MVLHSGGVYSSNRFQLSRAEINRYQSLIWSNLKFCRLELMLSPTKNIRSGIVVTVSIDLCLVVRIFKAEMTIF